MCSEGHEPFLKEYVENDSILGKICDMLRGVPVSALRGSM